MSETTQIHPDKVRTYMATDFRLGHTDQDIVLTIGKHSEHILVQKINLLETNPEAGSLDLKTIHNFSRFRINDSFRALFFPKGNIKEFFAFGEHDLYL
jgi:hypothetical protein